jgi:hypothetical protein
MDSLNKITLKSFLAALLRQDSSLPELLQKRANECSTSFLAKIETLDALAAPPLEEEYMEARAILQDDGERFRSSTIETEASVEVNDDKLLNLASEVLKAEDSVTFIKKAYATSPELQLLFKELGYADLEYQKDAASSAEANDRETKESQTYRYNIAELVGKFCIDTENGEKIYALIHPQLLAGNPVELDFSGVEICVSSFLSFAVGQLLADIPQESLDKLLTVSHLNPVGMRSFNRVLRNFNHYYSIPDFHSRVDKVIDEFASSY